VCAAVEALRRERVTDPKGFITQHVPEARLLASHFVTPVFVSHVERLVSARVGKDGWSDVKDPERPLPSEDERILRQILQKVLPGIHEILGFLVSDDLEAKLQAKCREVARSRAEDAWAQRTKKRSADLRGFNWQEVSHGSQE
jgi:hypothetical protein